MKSIICTNARISVVAAALGLMAVSTVAPAQQFPDRPVRLIAPFAPGGGSDINARRLAEKLTGAWKQPVVVQNIAGGAGNVAAVTVASSQPDGQTLFFASLPIIVTNPVMYEKVPFNADKDFAPVVHISDTPHVLVVSASFRATTLQQLIAVGREKPGAINYGSGGQGTSLHLAAELFNSMTGISGAHIPYKGAAPAITALLSDEIQMLFDNGQSAVGHIRGGRLRGLGVASKQRIAVLQDVPTFEEQGLAGFVSGVPHGVLVRSGTPQNLIDFINKTINQVLDDPEYRKVMAAAGANIAGGTPAALKAYVESEKKKWLPLIQRNNIRAY